MINDWFKLFFQGKKKIIKRREKTLTIGIVTALSLGVCAVLCCAVLLKLAVVAVGRTFSGLRWGLCWRETAGSVENGGLRRSGAVAPLSLTLLLLSSEVRGCCRSTVAWSTKTMREREHGVGFVVVTLLLWDEAWRPWPCCHHCYPGLTSVICR